MPVLLKSPTTAVISGKGVTARVLKHIKPLSNTQLLRARLKIGDLRLMLAREQLHPLFELRLCRADLLL